MRTRLTELRPRAMPGALALLAAVVLTVLVVAALVVPRWLGHLAPSATSGSVPNCLLPVYVGSEVGFVDTQTGRYTKAVSASVAGLPDSFASRPFYYSSALKRWLPVSVSYMSPDGRSYAWIRFLPDGSTQANFKTAELHRYEVATQTDQALWTTTVFFIVWRWDAAGILVSVPPSGSDRAPANWWLVDPLTGAAPQQVSSSHASLYSFTPLAGDPTDISFSSVGVDAEGHPIWWLFTNGKGGGVNWVFYETAPGQRVFIYRGPKDDASALDPLAAMADSTGIWFSDYRDPNVIRHWQQGTGLRNVMVTGLPAVDQGTFPGAIPSSPCSPPAARPLPLPSPEVGGIFALIPPGDFEAAGLSSATALVTPFQLNAANGARKLTFIGAYADPARTVLLFSTNRDQEPCQYPRQYARCFTIPPTISISDDQGSINASSSTGGGLPDEYFFSLDAGPRPGADGIANLTVTVPGFSPNGPADGSQPAPGEWAFSFALKVQPSVTIGAVPSQFDLGSWKVTTEVAEVTPSVIHVQTVINGALVTDVVSTTVVLLDSSGTPVNQIVTTAAVTVPKQQLNSTNDKITRVNDQWLRPAAGGTYQLKFAGGGGARTININVAPPDPNAKVRCLKPATCFIGAGPGPTPPFPMAPESLTLDGFLTTTLTSGPNWCSIGGGSSGTMFFFGTYFQVDGVWLYSLDIRSDPNLRQYSGPGTYTAIAWLYGPTQRLYAGTVSLTVTADHYPGPYRGSVQGTLDRVATATQQQHLSVSGTWTCKATAP